MPIIRTLSVGGNAVEGSTVDGSAVDGSAVDESTVDGSTVDGSTVDAGTVDGISTVHGLLAGTFALLALIASMVAAIWLADVAAALAVPMLEQAYRLPGVPSDPSQGLRP